MKNWFDSSSRDSQDEHSNNGETESTDCSSNGKPGNNFLCHKINHCKITQLHNISADSYHHASHNAECKSKWLVVSERERNC